MCWQYLSVRHSIDSRDQHLNGLSHDPRVTFKSIDLDTHPSHFTDVATYVGNLVSNSLRRQLLTKAFLQKKRKINPSSLPCY